MSNPALRIVERENVDKGKALEAALGQIERSFGKGTMQNLIPVEAGRSSLKLTIATYWRPSEKNIHRMSTSKDTDDWGVRPDADGEVKLDPQQEVGWQEARRRRDGRCSGRHHQAERRRRHGGFAGQRLCSR